MALILFSGCGSSSSESTGRGPDTTASGDGSLTRAEFIAKADALCEASKAKQEPLREHLEEVARRARSEEQEGGVADGTRRELAETLERIVTMAEASLSQVQALGPPKDEDARLEAIFQKTESAFESSRAYGAALEGHEDAKAQEIAEEGNVETRETASLAEQYGFRVCGSQP